MSNSNSTYSNSSTVLNPALFKKAHRKDTRFVLLSALAMLSFFVSGFVLTEIGFLANEVARGVYWLVVFVLSLVANIIVADGSSKNISLAELAAAKIIKQRVLDEHNISLESPISFNNSERAPITLNNRPLKAINARGQSIEVVVSLSGDFKEVYVRQLAAV